MPSASPQLLETLNAWGKTRTAVRRAADRAADVAREGRIPVDDAWRDIEQQHRSDVAQLEAVANQLAARWVERLRRLEQWKSQTLEAQREYDRIAGVLASHEWFLRLRTLAEPLRTRWMRRADALELLLQQLSETMVGLAGRLEERFASLHAFQERSEKAERPLLVSRSRKAPEVVFVAEQGRNLIELRDEILEASAAGERTLNRVYQLTERIGEKVAAFPALLEPRRREILDTWKQPMKRLIVIRERVLGMLEGLTPMEERLTAMKTIVSGMQCVEDVYKRRPSLWQRLVTSRAARR